MNIREHILARLPSANIAVRAAIRERILALSDEGNTPAQIAAAISTAKLPQIYATLRAERPNRKRAPRPCTSAIPATVLGMKAAGIREPRIANLLGVSRAYVYRIVANA
jgi:hypothetical protein